jgi:hypothetical protein
VAFDPDQPRDDHGKWTHGGGAGHYDALTVNTILNHGDAAKPGSRSNGDIAKYLNQRGSDALKTLGVASGKILPPAKGAKETLDPKEANILSSAIASEIEDELKRGGQHAEDWYTNKMQDAMGVAEKMHPEMANNPAAKFAFTSAMAITSQGETVPSNIRLANDAYENFAKTGKFPTDVKSDAGKEMNLNFDKLNKLIDTMGVAGTKKFLDTEFTVRDLNKMGYPVSGENKDTKVYGSAILGPKIGQGFYQNLNGNFKPLTADMWLMRGWGRLTGTLTGGVDAAKPKARFEAALKDAGEKIPKTADGLVNRAVQIRLDHTNDFKHNREDFDSGKKSKSELTYAAERYEVAMSGTKDQPAGGGQRQQIRDVFDQAQQKLKDAGHPMSIADMQATWWYPEKRLYSKLGSRNTERINTDYATELRALATKKGIQL